MKYLNRLPHLFLKIKKAGGSTILAKLALVIIAAATEILLVHMLTPSGRGDVFYIRTIADILGIVFVFGLGNSAIYFSKELDKSLNIFLGYCAGIVFIALLVAVVGYIKLGDQGARAGSILLLSVLTAIYFYIQRLYIAFGDYSRHNISSLAPKMLFLGALFGVYASSKNFDVLLIVLILALSHLALVPMIFRLWKNRVGGGRQAVLSEFGWRSLKYGFSTLVPNLGGALKLRVEIFLIIFFFGDSVLGSVAVSKSFLAPLAVVTSATSLLLLRHFSQNLESRPSPWIFSVIPVIAALAFLGAISINRLLDWGLIPQAYVDVDLYFFISASGFAFLTASTLLQSYLFAQGMSMAVTRSMIFSSVPLLVAAFFPFKNAWTLLAVAQSTYVLQFMMNLLEYRARRHRV